MADADPYAKYAPQAQSPADADPYAKYAAKQPADPISLFTGFVKDRAADVGHWYGQFVDRQAEIAKLQDSPNPADRTQAARLADQNSFTDWISHVPDLVTRPIARNFARGKPGDPQYEADVDQMSGDFGMALGGALPIMHGMIGELPIRTPAPHMVDAFTTAKAPKPVEAPGAAKPAAAADVAPGPEPAPAARPQAGGEPFRVETPSYEDMGVTHRRFSVEPTDPAVRNATNDFGTGIRGDVSHDGAVWQVRGSGLPPDSRGTGMGAAMYERAAQAAADDGARLVSDQEVTAEAANTWEALGRRGYEVRRNPSAELKDGKWLTPDKSPVFEVHGGRPKSIAATVETPAEPTIAAPAEGEPPAPTGGPLSFVRPVEPKSFWADRKAEIDGKGWAGAIADWAEHGYTALVAEQHPLVRATEQLRSDIEGATGKPVDLLPSEDPTKLARAGHDVFNIGHMDVMHGVHDYRGVEPTSPALADVVAAVTQKAQRGGLDPPGALKQFNDYLTARRGVEEWDRYGRGEIPNEPLPVASGGDRANLEMHIAQAEAANPHYVEMADSVNQYGRALWKKQLDAGLISRETYDGANNAREFYVPFKRAMDETATIKGSGASGEGSIAKGFGGSNRDVLGPMEALVNQTYEVARRIRQNDINLSLVNLGRQFEEVMAGKGVEAPNGLLERVKEPNRPMGLAPDELKAMTNRNAPDDLIDTMFDEDAMHVWRPGEINAKGRAIIYTWENGKRAAWEIKDPEWGADIFNAMTGVSKPVDDLIMRVGAAASATLRAGVTTNPEFMFTNFLRDQMAAWIVTGDGFIPGEGALGVVDELGGADVSRRYNLAAGISGGQAVEAARSAAIQADIMSLRHKGFVAKYVPTLDDALHDQMNVIRKVASIAEVTETGTRLQLFKRAYARAIGEGMSEHDAILEAGFTARDYIDFGRNGSRMAATRKVVTFLNASIQGLDKTLRTVSANGAVGGRVALKDVLRPLFEDTPDGMRTSDAKALRLAYSAWTKMGVIAGLGLTLEAIYHDDPQYQNISEYGRASAWFFKIGDKWMAVPKPFVEGLPSNIAERAFEATYGQDDRAWGRLARGAMQNLALPSSNPLWQTNIELATNKNMMTGGSIVPDQKLSMLPQDQYAYYNSDLAKHLGAAIGVSPAKLDHMLTGYFGSWGRWAQTASNLNDPDRPAMGLSDMVLSRRFFPSWQRGAQDSTDFFQRVGSRTSEFQQLFNSVKERQDAGHPDQAQELLGRADAGAKIYVASRMANDGKARNLNPLSRAQTVGTEIGRVISELYGEPERGVQKTFGAPDEASQLPKMNPDQKGVVQNVLEQLAVVEMRNAMIATHQPGFEHKKPMDRAAYLGQLQAASPGVATALQRRLDSGREKAWDYDATMKAWPAVEARLRRDGSKADLSDIMMDVRGASQH